MNSVRGAGVTSQFFIVSRHVSSGEAYLHACQCFLTKVKRDSSRSGAQSGWEGVQGLRGGCGRELGQEHQTEAHPLAVTLLLPSSKHPWVLPWFTDLSLSPWEHSDGFSHAWKDPTQMVFWYLSVWSQHLMWHYLQDTFNKPFTSVGAVRPAVPPCFLLPWGHYHREQQCTDVREHSTLSGNILSMCALFFCVHSSI